MREWIISVYVRHIAEEILEAIVPSAHRRNKGSLQTFLLPNPDSFSGSYFFWKCQVGSNFIPNVTL